MQKRAAFSMIELIFAIVIMGISVMTIPLMLSQNANNNAFSAVQESILAARTKMGNILTYDWDSKSRTSGAKVFIRVLDVSNGDGELARNDSTQDQNRRIGHSVYDLRRRLYDGNSTNTTLPSTDDLNVTKSAINHFNRDLSKFDINSTSGDYLFRELNMTANIYYIPDIANYASQTVNFNYNISSKTDVTVIANSTNIKMIELTVRNPYSPTFVFRTFSCNIGQTELLDLNTLDIP